MPNPTCIAPNCDRKYVAKGLCQTHYARAKRGISLDLPIRRPLAERFREKFVMAGPDECWIWTAAHVRDGYGRIGNVPATRVAWELEYGVKVPPGTLMCHTCDNPPCVNPRHLFLGDPRANYEDMAAKGRRGNPHPEPKLSAADIRDIMASVTGRRGEKKELAAQYGVSSALISLIVNHGHRNEEARMDAASEVGS